MSEECDKKFKQAIADGLDGIGCVPCNGKGQGCDCCGYRGTHILIRKPLPRKD